MKSRIREYREKNNMSLDDLAKKVGVMSPETITFLEECEDPCLKSLHTGSRYNPCIRIAQLVAKALNTTVDELFNFDK
jgi:putative transcriptional regulator